MSFEELMKDEEFAKAVNEAEDVETVLELLKGKGIEITDEDLKQAYDLLEKNGEELDEDALEEVSGGFIGVALAVGIALGMLAYMISKGLIKRK